MNTNCKSHSRPETNTSPKDLSHPAWVEQTLRRLGFKQVKANRWEKTIAGAQVSVTMPDDRKLCLRWEWFDGQYHNVQFFEFGKAVTNEEAEFHGFLSCAALYVAGIHLPS